MTTLTAAPQTRKPITRLVGVLEPETAATPGLLRIVVGGETATYWFREIESGFMGRAFEVRKFRSEETYHVHLGGRGTCTCKGSTYTGHCKHADGLKALAANGKLPAFRSLGDFARNAPDEYRDQYNYEDGPIPADAAHS